MTLVSRDLVLKKARQMFPQENPSDIMEFLDIYGTDNHERERERVQLAVLKLSRGNLDLLLNEIDAAKQDYRDTLAYAEYPNQMRASANALAAIAPEEAKLIRDRDRQQYLEWLHSGE